MNYPLISWPRQSTVGRRQEHSHKSNAVVGNDIKQFMSYMGGKKKKLKMSMWGKNFLSRSNTLQLIQLSFCSGLKSRRAAGHDRKRNVLQVLGNFSGNWESRSRRQFVTSSSLTHRPNRLGVYSRTHRPGRNLRHNRDKKLDWPPSAPTMLLGEYTLFKNASQPQSASSSLTGNTYKSARLVLPISSGQHVHKADISQ